MRRRFMNLSRHLALVAMLGTPLAACGKKDPEPVAPLADVQVSPQAQAGDIAPKAEEKVAEAAAPDATAPAEPTPAADPLPAGAPPDRAALVTSSVATLPDGIVALAGTSNFGELFNTFATQVGKLEGTQLPPDALQGFLKGAKDQVGFDLSWLDTDKPLRFAIPDPKKHENGFIMVFAVKADTKLEPTLFAGATAGADGHWAKIPFQGRDFYIDLVEGHLLITSDGAFAKQYEGFIKELTAWVPSSPLVLDTSVENLRKTFAAELAQGKEMAEMIAGMASDAENPGQSAQIKEMADMGFALVEGLNRMGFALDFSGDFPRIGITMTGTPESPLGKFAATTKDRKASFAKAAPAEAWMVFGYDVPGTGYFTNFDSIVDQLSAQEGNPIAPNFTDAEKTELKGKLQKLLEYQGSQSVSWIKQEGSLPFIFEGLADSTDGAALLAGLLDAGDYIFKKMWTQVRKQVLASGAPADQAPETMTFKDFAAFFTRNAGAMGISLAATDATSPKGAKSVGLEVNVDWKRLPMKEEGKIVADLLGEKIGIGLSGHEKFFAAAVGPDAAKRAGEVIDRGVPENTDPWLTEVSESTFFVLLRPARMLKVLATHVPDLAEKKAMIDTLTDDPFVITGKSDGTTLSFEIVMSAKHIEALSLLK